MARKLRDDDPGLFHIGSHSVWTGVLYRDDVDRVLFLTELARITARLGWTIICFTLLPTHFHVLAETCDRSLSEGMKRLNMTHACRFNARHKLRGHVVDGRFWSRRVEGDLDLLSTYRYVARNACEAGLCDTPGDWPWCSYRSLIKPVHEFSFVDVSLVLGCWQPAGDAITELRQFVEGPG